MRADRGAALAARVFALEQRVAEIEGPTTSLPERCRRRADVERLTRERDDALARATAAEQALELATQQCRRLHQDELSYGITPYP